MASGDVTEVVLMMSMRIWIISEITVAIERLNSATTLRLRGELLARLIWMCRGYIWLQGSCRCLRRCHRNSVVDGYVNLDNLGDYGGDRAA